MNSERKMIQSRRTHDLPTVAAVGLLAMCVVTICHEAVGHAGTCLLLGGHISLLTSSLFRCTASSGWVDAGGPILNLVCGLLALIAFRFIPLHLSRTRLFLLLVTALSWLWEGGYAIHAMHHEDGDLYSFVLYLLRYISVAERCMFAALGLALYVFTVRLTSHELLRPVGRELLIDANIDRSIDAAYNDPIKNSGITRHRRRAWTVVVCVDDAGMRPGEVFPMRIEHLDFNRRRIWVPDGKTPNARRLVGMTYRMAELLKEQVGDRKDGFVLASKRSKCGHLTSIAKSFQEARKRGKVPSKVVLYSGRHTYGTYAMEKTGNIFAVSKAMGHGSIQSMKPYQHPNDYLDAITEVVNQRNLARG